MEVNANDPVQCIKNKQQGGLQSYKYDREIKGHRPAAQQ